MLAEERSPLPHSFAGGQGKVPEMGLYGPFRAEEECTSASREESRSRSREVAYLVLFRCGACANWRHAAAYASGNIQISQPDFLSESSRGPGELILRAPLCMTPY